MNSKKSISGRAIFSLTPKFEQFLSERQDKTVSEMYKDMIKEFPEYKNKTEASLRYFLKCNNIKHRAKDNSKKVITSTKTHKHNNIIYTPDMIQYIKNTFGDGTELTAGQIISILKKEYPGVSFTSDNLYRCFSRLNIKYNKRDRKNNSNKLDSSVSTEEIDSTLAINTNSNKDISLDNINIDVKQNKVNTYNDDMITRLKPIYDEVNSVAESKFKELDCYIDKDIDTQTYINLLEMLLYLAQNYDKLNLARKNQHDIMTAYQSDVIHEQERILSKPGDTYLQDKLYVLRNKRRFYQYDSQNLNALKPFLQTVNITKLQLSLQYLKQNLDKREDMKFIPLVDAHMVDKYDWAIVQDPEYSEIKPKLISTTSSRQEDKNKSKLSRYVVTCRLSGGGYGAFSPWRQIYTCETSDIAKNMALKDIKSLQDNTNSILYTGLTVIKLSD